MVENVEYGDEVMGQGCPRKLFEMSRRSSDAVYVAVRLERWPLVHADVGLLMWQLARGLRYWLHRQMLFN